MSSTAATVGFIGDLDDPWVAAIADAIPAAVRVERLHCAGDIPEEAFGPRPDLRLIVLHRHRLSNQDRARLKRWREQADAAAGDGMENEAETRTMPTVFLCVSPYVRYEEVERVLGLVDQVIPEGTAADILPGRVVRVFEGRFGGSRPGRRRDADSFVIEVSGKNEDLCRTLAAVCVKAGYRAVATDDLLTRDIPLVRPASLATSTSTSASATAPAPVPERTLTIWEVPILEAGWPEILERRAVSTGPLIGLMGFADRAAVSLAKAKGAAACLDLPFEIDDLIDAVERVAGSYAPEHWPLPARLEPPHQLPPRPRRRAAAREPSSAARPWRE